MVRPNISDRVRRMTRAIDVVAHSVERCCWVWHRRHRCAHSKLGRLGDALSFCGRPRQKLFDRRNWIIEFQRTDESCPFRFADCLRQVPNVTVKFARRYRVARSNVPRCSYAAHGRRETQHSQPDRDQTKAERRENARLKHGVRGEKLRHLVC